MARLGECWLVSERAGDSMSSSCCGLSPVVRDVDCTSIVGDNSCNRNKHESIRRRNRTPVITSSGCGHGFIQKRVLIVIIHHLH